MGLWQSEAPGKQERNLGFGNQEMDGGESRGGKEANHSVSIATGHWGG